jgi:D-glycerate 3-kinase
MPDPLWPKGQLFLTREELSNLRRDCYDSFVVACKQMEIEEDLTPWLESLYLPLAAWLERRRKMEKHSLVVGLCGAQGSGKSTVASLLRLLLDEAFGERTVTLSLDDLYKTKAERQTMAQTVHPLFATRGVPGTHDAPLGIDTIERLRGQGEGESTSITTFDKARDERQPRPAWPTITGPVDITIFEGWCVGALPQPPQDLTTPINDLERHDDPDGAWRNEVNDILARDYQKLFSLIDVLLMLKVEGMEKVFEWRRLQEHKLARKAAHEATPQRELRIMSDAEVDRFIMHYERLTRHILSEMPGRADIVLRVGETHNPASIQINRPLT